jgi:hypothetical protein
VTCNGCGSALLAPEHFDAGLCGVCLRGSCRQPVRIGTVTVIPRVQLRGSVEVPGWRAVRGGSLGAFAETPEGAAIL